ncbi:hypothetical protein, partial [Paenibacillus cookii]|uniref:hypothetical protein n=1 Tax=Paenibacillus cookii TaxID=157839 RepID=UPI001BB3A46F
MFRTLRELNWLKPKKKGLLLRSEALRLSRNPLFFCRGFKIASSVTEVGFSERFKSIFILKDMIPHI